MRIMVHSNGPHVPTGYGKQCRLLLTALQKAGHDVACSAFYGVSGSTMEWNGITILPAGMLEFGKDVLIPHAQYWEAEAIVTLMDFWKLADLAGALGQFSRDARVPIAAWLPNDCEPLGAGDRQALRDAGAYPIAMSKFGQRNLRKAGWDAPRMPHAVETDIYHPMSDADRYALRVELGVDGRFVVGICSANRDAVRKAWPEQFRAFAQFRKKCPDALLMVHSTPWCPSGYNLQQLADDMELTGHVMFSEQYAQTAGHMNDHTMAQWYAALDVLSACSYAEAFGVPMIEAQACGTPVVSTLGSAMIENTGAGLHAIGDPFWNAIHRAWWVRPDIKGLTEAYEAMHELWETDRILTMRDEASRFALKFDVEHVAEKYWLPVLTDLPKIGEVVGAAQ